MNKRRRKAGTFSIVLGLLLIAAALSLTGYNYLDSQRAGEAAEEILHEIALPESLSKTSPKMHMTIRNEPLEIPLMATQEVNGLEIIGILEVPSCNLRLPVASGWSYEKLEVAPCVYTGSYFTDDLVICGHNYATHFSPLKFIPVNSDIYLTTVDGFVYHYQVNNLETVHPTSIEQMITSTDWDLTLFTCHSGGQTRCAVRCTRITN